VSHSKMLDAYGTSTVTMAPRYNRADKILGAGEVDFWQTSLDTGNRFIGTAFQPSHSTAMRPSRGLFEGSSSLPPNRRGRLCWTRFSARGRKWTLRGCFRHPSQLYTLSLVEPSFFLSTNYPSIYSTNYEYSSPPTIRLSSPSLSVYPLHHCLSPSPPLSVSLSITIPLLSTTIRLTSLCS